MITAAHIGDAFPRDGDVVVTQESLPRLHYTLRQLPGMVQFSANNRDEAVRLALTFAEKYRIDVWYCERGLYHHVDGFREPARHAAP